MNRPAVSSDCQSKEEVSCLFCCKTSYVLDLVPCSEPHVTWTAKCNLDTCCRCSSKNDAVPKNTANLCGTVKMHKWSLKVFVCDFSSQQCHV